MASKKVKFTNNQNGHCQLCTDSDDKGAMIGCDECYHWFHQHCAGVKVLPGKKESWFCPKCTSSGAQSEESSSSLQNVLVQMMDLHKKAFEHIAFKTTNNQEKALNEMMQSFKTAIEVKSEANSMAVDTSMAANNLAADATVRQLNKFVKRQALMELPDFDGSFKT